MIIESKAKLRYLRMGPRKVRLLIDLIRGMKVKDAVLQLQFSKKRAAKPILKLLNSAVANAIHNHDMIEDTLVIKTAFVDGGPVLKRWMPRAMGRATPIRKRTSHVTIVLAGESKGKQESPGPGQDKKSKKQNKKDKDKKKDVKKKVSKVKKDVKLEKTK